MEGKLKHGGVEAGEMATAILFCGSLSASGVGGVATVPGEKEGLTGGSSRSMKKVKEERKITSGTEREAMRVSLGPQARCIYPGNDSHLD